MKVKFNESDWSGIFKSPGIEKPVSKQFSQAVVENYLALQKEKHYLLNRIKEVMIPFRTVFIFVYILLVDFVNRIGLYRKIDFKKERRIPLHFTG
jgi:hypothetical protein